ncbi:MAG: AMIN domain-containing protein [Elusimicrobia bacterium]|jgi:type IV pilus secretin PilQ/predicted competence protein|nr:AMIN domain-containing protein [Elusimicrobiota bacterium]
MKKIIAVLLTGILFTAGYTYGQDEEKSHPWEELIKIQVAGRTQTGVRVEMETTGKVKFHVFRVSNPPRLVVEMADTVHNWRKKDLNINGNIIKKVRSGQYKNEPIKMVRVVLDMAVEEYQYEQVSTDNQVTISVSLTKEGVKKVEAQKETAKAKQKALKKEGGLNLKPNVSTEEHKSKIQEVLSQKQERDEKKKERVTKIEKINKKVDVVDKTSKKDGTGSGIDGYLPTEAVDFNFKNADIREVLRAFEIKLDKNILPSDSVQGQVTLRLKNVPFNEAFNMLMDRMDLVAVRTSENIVEVMTRADMPTQRRTFNLTNRNASEVQSTVSGLLTSEESSETTIVIDDASNAIMVAATPEVLNKIALIINQIDVKSPQIKIKCRLIEVSAGKDFSAGVTWATSIPFTGSDIQQIRAAKDLGNYSLDAAGDIDTDDTVTGFGQGAVMDISAVLDNTQLYGVLNFLATKSEAKTLSEPTILTENNKSASIHVGQNLPVRTSEVTESGTTQSIQFISEGVDLSVTPVVSAGSKQISLDVDISVSELVGFRADNPITAERSAQTEVTIESGKTVIIGGLIREKKTETESGVPLLKDIPLLGYLFKNKGTLTDRTELLIFLSPEILTD